MNFLIVNELFITSSLKLRDVEMAVIFMWKIGMWIMWIFSSSMNHALRLKHNMLGYRLESVHNI